MIYQYQFAMLCSRCCTVCFKHINKKGIRKYFIKLTYYEFKWLSISQIPRETVNQVNRFNSIQFNLILSTIPTHLFSPFITFIRLFLFHNCIRFAFLTKLFPVVWKCKQMLGIKLRDKNIENSRMLIGLPSLGLLWK